MYHMTGLHLQWSVFVSSIIGLAKECIINARRMHARVTVVCLFVCQSVTTLLPAYPTCVQQIELTRQVFADLQRFSSDEFR